jgi:hypothetical protein
MIPRSGAAVQGRGFVFVEFADRNFLESGEFSKFSLATVGYWWYDDCK